MRWQRASDLDGWRLVPGARTITWPTMTSEAWRRTVTVTASSSATLGQEYLTKYAFLLWHLCVGRVLERQLTLHGRGEGGKVKFQSREKRHFRTFTGHFSWTVTQLFLFSCRTQKIFTSLSKSKSGFQLPPFQKTICEAATTNSKHQRNPSVTHLHLKHFK